MSTTNPAFRTTNPASRTTTLGPAAHEWLVRQSETAMRAYLGRILLLIGFCAVFTLPFVLTGTIQPGPAKAGALVTGGAALLSLAAFNMLPTAPEAGRYAARAQGMTPAELGTALHRSRRQPTTLPDGRLFETGTENGRTTITITALPTKEPAA